MKAMCVLVFVLLLVSLSQAQQKWQRSYGGTDADWGLSVKQTFDGGYIVTGSTLSFPPGDWNAYLIRTYSNGDTLWTRVFRGSDVTAGNAVVQTPDSAYVLAGTSNSMVYLVKVLPQGDTLWTRRWGGMGQGGAADIIRTQDGSFVLTGWSGYSGYYDVLLAKTDASGDTLWTKTYGGYQNATGYSVCQTTDSGFIVVGPIQKAKKEAAPGGRPTSPSMVDGRRVPALPFRNRMGQRLPLDDVPAQNAIYLLKTNASGDSLWSKVIGGTGDDIGESVQPTSDGGYIVAGSTNSFGAGGYDVYLIKTNTSGDTLWTKTYGGTNWDIGNSVRQTTDGGYLIAGYTYPYGAAHDDVYLIRTNASGDALWTRTYGGTNSDEGWSVQQTSDGGYIIAGQTYSFEDTLYGDVYLIKTDANGNVGVEEQEGGRQKAEGVIKATPNPFVSHASVPGHEGERFKLYDVMGRMVGTFKGDRIGEGLAAGVYFLRSLDTKGKPLRIVKVR